MPGGAAACWAKEARGVVRQSARARGAVSFMKIRFSYWMEAGRWMQEGKDFDAKGATFAKFRNVLRGRRVAPQFETVDRDVFA
jgi:hypothetical protein